MGVYVELPDAGTEDEEMQLRGELRGLDMAMDEMRGQRARLVEFLLKAELSKRRLAATRHTGENEMRLRLLSGEPTQRSRLAVARR